MKPLQPLIYAALIAIGFYLGSANKNSVNTVDSKLNNVMQMINEHYVDSVNHISFEDKAINAILQKLDPHSSYISTQEFKSIAEDMQGSFSGIGIEFNIIEDSIVVISPISGGPSEKLGIKSGDRIISIENKNVASIGIRNEEVIKNLRGDKGSSVNIIIKRRGEDDLIPFTIIRDDIPLYSVDAGIMLNNNIGYIKISQFAAKTYNEMMKKATMLLQNNMTKLIVDFRGNPGGYLHVANQIADEFLTDGELIVFTEGINRAKKEIYATNNGLLENIEVIVIINEGSASASEIVAGALQDNDRGLIIGRRSFGKGLVQEQVDLNDGSVIRLTTQRYFTPSGRCIQKSYGKNTKDYHLEQYNRQDTSEYHVDSLKYTTKSGRLVYGGGGITPDIIIERDPATNYTQINKLIHKGWVNEFCFETSEKIKTLGYKSHREISIDNLYNNFVEYIQKKDRKFNLQS